MLTGSVQDRLPEPLKTAQAAIHLPEVQEMLRRLAAFNLGICMPHMHGDDNGGLIPLPSDTVQMEQNLSVSFVPAASVTDATIDVAWRWVDDGVSPGCKCVSSCHKSHDMGHEGEGEWSLPRPL